MLLERMLSILLENNFDKSSVKQIRMNCQCGYAMDEKLALVNELLESSSNLEEFANQEKAKAAGLSCKDGELYLQFAFCPCPMLADMDRLDTDTWCQCTTGYSKVLFEKAFGCEVDVELLKSVKMGDDICLNEDRSPRFCLEIDEYAVIWNTFKAASIWPLFLLK